jgi:hypothetical protein
MTMRRWSALTAVSALVLSVLITWLLAAMRAQMEVGASCASGGPYVVVAPCPENTTALVLVGMFGGVFAALLGTVAAVSAGAPNLLVPYWTFTIGGMAVSFVVDGLTDEGGLVWSWILVGILNLLIALPGLYLMSPWQKVYDREPMKGALLSRQQWWLAYLALAAVGVGLGSWSAFAWL